jgi:hypothetical protein
MDERDFEIHDGDRDEREGERQRFAANARKLKDFSIDGTTIMA